MLAYSISDLSFHSVSVSQFDSTTNTYHLNYLVFLLSLLTTQSLKNTDQKDQILGLTVSKVQ